MNIRISLKISLFAFLSALVCLIANTFLGLLEIQYASEFFWFASYVFLVIWLCKYVAKIKKFGVNMVFSFVTFALALYTGVYSSFLADEVVADIGYLVFYITGILCLASILILLGRWIFGKPESSAPLKEEPHAEAPAEWKCACGAANTGKFCTECGNSKPTEEKQNEEVI